MQRSYSILISFILFQRGECRRKPRKKSAAITNIKKCTRTHIFQKIKNYLCISTTKPPSRPIWHIPHALAFREIIPENLFCQQLEFHTNVKKNIKESHAIGLKQHKIFSLWLFLAASLSLSTYYVTPYSSQCTIQRKTTNETKGKRKYTLAIAYTQLSTSEWIYLNGFWSCTTKFHIQSAANYNDKDKKRL